MTRAIKLQTTSQHHQYGDFVTGLFIMEGSSSDEFGAGNSDITAPVRDVLAAVPILRWIPPSEDDNIVEAITKVQAVAVDAIRQGDGTLPLTLNPSLKATFLVDEKGLRIQGVDGRRLGLFGGWTFQLEDRLRWFLENGETLGIQIMSPSGDPWVTSLTIGGRPPRLAVKNGNIASKELSGLINHSTSWTFAHLGNVSLFPDARDVADHHYRTYAATPKTADIPNITYHGPCLGCGASNLTREHCTPNWISHDLGVGPVVAHIFCGVCNSYFGDEFEIPIAGWYRAGTLLQPETRELFSKWAIKTALTLAAASDVSIQESWMRELRNGAIPKGFEVFASMGIFTHPGYTFAVSHFSAEDQKRGQFLTSFVLGAVSVVVAHAAPQLNKIWELPRIHPSRRPADTPTGGQSSSGGLHHKILSRMANSQLGFTPSKMKAVTPRQPRGKS